MLEEYQPFILKTASGILHRYITPSDDAWSIALIAFWEAVDQYRAEKGGFPAYAQLVIRRRLIDFQRREARYAPEIDVAPETFTGDPEEDAPPAPLAKARQTAEAEDRVGDEIAEVAKCLQEYGFSFQDLVEASPKSEKTKQSCATAAAFLLQQPDLLAQMRRCHRLPVSALSLGARVSAKCIDRHRNYLIAAVEIMDGDYPELSAYLPLIRKKVKP